MKKCTTCKKERSSELFRKGKKQCNICADSAHAKYLATEKGYFIEKYNNIVSKYIRYKRHGKRDYRRTPFTEEELKLYQINLTHEEFFNLWKKQKEIYGMLCPVTGVEMTRVRNAGNKKKKSICPSNISVDRLDNSKGYTAENIIFVTADFNARKNAIYLNECKRVLELAQKRNLYEME